MWNIRNIKDFITIAVTSEGGYLRFYSELSKEIKMMMRFKVTEMVDDGGLES